VFSDKWKIKYTIQKTKSNWYMESQRSVTWTYRELQVEMEIPGRLIALATLLVICLSPCVWSLSISGRSNSIFYNFDKALNQMNVYLQY
jgi:hypothetical protein